MPLTNFNSRLAYGQFGEKIVAEYLYDNNEIVFSTPAFTSAPIDFISISDGRVELIEVKTKTVENNAFTLSTADMEAYTALVFNNRLPLTLYVVDVTNGKLYKSSLANILRVDESTNIKLPKFYKSYGRYSINNMEYSPESAEEIGTIQRSALDLPLPPRKTIDKKLAEKLLKQMPLRWRG